MLLSVPPVKQAQVQVANQNFARIVLLGPIPVLEPPHAFRAVRVSSQVVKAPLHVHYAIKVHIWIRSEVHRANLVLQVQRQAVRERVYVLIAVLEVSVPARVAVNVTLAVKVPMHQHVH